MRWCGERFRWESLTYPSVKQYDRNLPTKHYINDKVVTMMGDINLCEVVEVKVSLEDPNSSIFLSTTYLQIMVFTRKCLQLRKYQPLCGGGGKRFGRVPLLMHQFVSIIEHLPTKYDIN